MTYFLIKKWQIPARKYVKILTVFLIIACFFERFFFIKSAYKTKNYGFILILNVIFFNTIFLWVIKKLRRRKHSKKLHELYNINKAPHAGGCVIFVVGILDIGKAFCMFWPANTMPLWLLVSLLQLKIPLNLILRTCCIDKVQNYKQTWWSAIVILLGSLLNTVRLTDADADSYGNSYTYYTIVFLTGIFLDVISSTMKEAIIRTQPLNQEEFNYQISVFQFVVALIGLPFIKGTQSENMDDSPFHGPEFDDLSYLAYAGQYIKYGMSCVFAHKSSQDDKFYNYGECDTSFLSIFLYALSLFVIQLTMNSIMHHKYYRYTQYVQATMVPLTFAAFWLATFNIGDTQAYREFDVYDILGLLITGVGVMMFNLYKEKPQKVCIEEYD